MVGPYGSDDIASNWAALTSRIALGIAENMAR